MPLVYVHGIANRAQNDGYEAASEHRDRLFRQFLVPVIGGSAADKIHSPYWGGEGGDLRWHGSSFPAAFLDEGRYLGTDEEPEVALEATYSEQPASPDQVLLTIAHRDLSDAVDLLYSVAPAPQGRAAAGMAEVARRLVAYLDRRERALPDGDALARYPWLDQVEDDADLVDRLVEEATPEADREQFLGAGGDVRDWFGRSLRRLRRTAAAGAGAPVAAAVGLARLKMAPLTATVVGDILTYLGKRGERDEPGPIVKCVADALDEAAAERTPERPMTVVAHSLGGVIAYDLLSHYRPDLVVDRFVTVGSQVGLFAELGLFRSTDPGLPSPAHPRIDPPGNIRRWINVVDRADPLAFRAEPIFRGVQDYRYPSGALWAHGAYLRQPRFHARLAARVADQPA